MLKRSLFVRIAGPTVLVSLLLLGLSIAAAVYLYKEQTLSDSDLGENVSSTQIAHDLDNTLYEILQNGNQPTAGAASSDCAPARRGGPARTNSFLQIWFSPAAQPPERGPCSRGHRSRCLNAGRFGRRGCGDAARCLDPQASVCGRAHPISPFRSLLGERPGPEDYGPMCATTDPVRSRPASCRLLLLA